MAAGEYDRIPVISSIKELFDFACSEYGDELLFIGSDITYADFKTRVLKAAGYIQSLSLKKGAHIMLYMNNSDEFTELFFAITCSGFVAVPVNPKIPDVTPIVERYDIDLVTIRNGKKIPMRNESTGILKIISIIQTLIAYCTFDNIFVAIDEMDAGIFEYLFGKLLSVLKALGKGQLFFSSHNLRPLEVLDYKNVYFSTSNPQKRYIKLTKVKPNNNLRIFYLRAIELGGQKEELYKDDDIAGMKIIFKRIAYELQSN